MAFKKNGSALPGSLEKFVNYVNMMVNLFCVASRQIPYEQASNQPSFLGLYSNNGMGFVEGFVQAYFGRVSAVPGAGLEIRDGVHHGGVGYRKSECFDTINTNRKKWCAGVDLFKKCSHLV